MKQYAVGRLLSAGGSRFSVAILVFVAFFVCGMIGLFFDAVFFANGPIAQSRLMVFNRINFVRTLPVAYEKRIAAIPGVQSVSRSVWFAGYVGELPSSGQPDHAKLLSTYAVEPASWLDIYSEWSLSADQREQFTKDPHSILVGERAAQRFGWHVGDHIRLTSMAYWQASGSTVWDLVIGGIFKANQPRISTDWAVMNYDYLNGLRMTAQDTTNSFVLTTASAAADTAVAEQIDTIFTHELVQTSTLTKNRYVLMFASQFGDPHVIVGTLVSALCATALVVFCNNFALTMRRRRPELLAMMASGLSPRSASTRALGAALRRAAVPAVAGLLVAVLYVYLARPAMVRSDLGDLAEAIVVTPGLIVAGLGLVVMFAVGAGLVAALYTATLVRNPVRKV